MNPDFPKRAIIRIAAFCLLICGVHGGEVSPNMAAAIDSGMTRTIRNDFDGAEETFRQLIRRHPGSPHGYFYLAATYQARMLDAESFDSLEAFDALLDTCISLSAAAAESQPELLFFEGSAYLYRSFMESKLNKMWSSFRNARRGSSRLEKLIKLDSTCYDAYLGVGSFKYWKSSKAKAFTWLPFVSDERANGIEMIRKAIANGRFTARVGRDQLAWIRMDAGDYEAAIDLARANYETCPESRFFRWTLAEAYYRGGHSPAAAHLYRGLLASVRGLPENNHLNELTCLVKLAELALGEGRPDEADRLAAEALALIIDPEPRERARKKREIALDIRRECAARMDEGSR